MGACLTFQQRGGMIRTVAIALALVAVVAVGSEETFAGVPLPPTASQAIHEEDPKAVALMKAHESKDQVLDFMQDAMMKTGAFMPAEDKANLAKMDGDLAEQKLEDALDRFAALRAKFTTFSAPEDDFEEVSKKKSKKHMAKPPMGRHTMKHPVYKAPPKYSAVPAGAAATAA